MTLSRTGIQPRGPFQQPAVVADARVHRDATTAADEQLMGAGERSTRFGSLAALLVGRSVAGLLDHIGEGAHPRKRSGGMTPRLRMSHTSSPLTPSSAAMIGSGSDDSAHARSNRALRLVGMRFSRSARVCSSSVRCSINRAVESAPALTATRQELAASISAFTHCAITDRIYVSYSFDVVAGSRSMTDLMASS